MQTKKQEFLKQLEKLTDANNHTEARLLIAKYFDLDYYSKIFKGIESICEAYGSLPSENNTFRNRMTNNMLLHISSVYGFEISQEIKSKL